MDNGIEHPINWAGDDLINGIINRRIDAIIIPNMSPNKNNMQSLQ